MKYALISDIHGNLEALEACLEAIDREAIDALLCLGDIVGYGACPNECLDIVRERADHVVIGNHDAAVIETTDAEYFNGDARAAVEWTREVLSPTNREFLAGLPYTITLDEDVLLVHSNPSDPPAWEYVLDQGDARLEFTSFTNRFCFVGHTHVPGFFVQRGDDVQQYAPPEYRLEAGERALVNVGSVGQPRDGDQRAAFGLIDTVAGLLQIHRVVYDVGHVQSRILQTALPQSAATRLAWGV